MRDSAGRAGQANKSYDELLGAPNLSDEERKYLRAEATLGHAAALLVLRGEKELAGILLEVKSATIEWDDQAREEDLWLEVAPEHQSLFTEEKLTRIRETCQEVSRRRDYGIAWVGLRETLPSVGPQWRDHVRQYISGKQQSNQGRLVRVEEPRFVEDHLAFTNEGELIVYRALKKIQEKDFPRDDTIGIFPLAGGRVLGRTWEPDVLVTYRNRAGVLEIDGPHHTGRRALDTSREHLLRDVGIAFVDRITVEAISNPVELNGSLHRFIKRLGDTK
ncbi:hypothetical protein GCM10010156_68490 [Planobispora rosea]|uniref:DUF559 domain-containing protein n=1 Tax=Planobispora rosea TaxID=35762 RepID=A0A8J3S7B7_PLARO|nr:hypothetical protein [Planobispora rosea]GGT00694.1 hypothetical protein GCM10010156_68490 [Planobispora rosea]GIH88169.1 hypothetical protein Pro02_65770 [Planobispora rosea]